MQQFTIPYRRLPGDSEARPYLVLQVTGPNGRGGPIYGVVDSGADQTCLPFRFTALMGYTVGNMRREQGMSASGPMGMWVAEDASSAHVVGLDEVELDLWPTFLPEGHVALWGRADLFRQFGILFEEEDQRLSLLLRE